MKKHLQQLMLTEKYGHGLVDNKLFFAFPEVREKPCEMV